MLNGLSFVTEVLFTNWLVCSTYLTAESFYGYEHHVLKRDVTKLDIGVLQYLKLPLLPGLHQKIQQGRCIRI